MPSHPIPAPEPHSPDPGAGPAAAWVRRVFRWPTCDSTNEAAFRALEQGVARDGDAFVSLEQTQGRGRRGSRWISKTGQGLYASFVFDPKCRFCGPKVTISAGLAARDAVRDLGLPNPHLKWPNDLLVGSAKLAGILVESRAWSAEQPIYVVGVGINVGQLEFPGDLSAERPVISLAQLGLTVGLERVERALFARLGGRLQQAQWAPAALGRDYLEALGFATDPVRVEVASETVTGVIASLEFDRGLELRLPQGHSRWLALEHIRSLSKA